MASSHPAAPPAAAQTEAPAEERSLSQWVEANQRLLLLVVAAVVVIGLGAWFLKSAADRKEAFASQQLAQARAVAEQGDLPRASVELQRVIDTYRGSSAAQEAVLSLNQIRMIIGQPELAMSGLQEFLDGNPDPRYVAPASALLGSALENSGRTAEAAEAYQRAAAAAGLGVLQADYLLKAGRAWTAAGQADKAIAAYQAILDDHDRTPMVTEARVRLAELTAEAI